MAELGRKCGECARSHPAYTCTRPQYLRVQYTVTCMRAANTATIIAVAVVCFLLIVACHVVMCRPSVRRRLCGKEVLAPPRREAFLCRWLSITAVSALLGAVFGAASFAAPWISGTQHYDGGSVTVQVFPWFAFQCSSYAQVSNPGQLPGSMTLCEGDWSPFIAMTLSSNGTLAAALAFVWLPIASVLIVVSSLAALRVGLLALRLLALVRYRVEWWGCLCCVRGCAVRTCMCCSGPGRDACGRWLDACCCDGCRASCCDCCFSDDARPRYGQVRRLASWLVWWSGVASALWWLLFAMSWILLSDAMKQALAANPNQNMGASSGVAFAVLAGLLSCMAVAGSMRARTQVFAVDDKVIAATLEQPPPPTNDAQATIWLAALSSAGGGLSLLMPWMSLHGQMTMPYGQYDDDSVAMPWASVACQDWQCNNFSENVVNIGPSGSPAVRAVAITGVVAIVLTAVAVGASAASAALLHAMTAQLGLSWAPWLTGCRKRLAPATVIKSACGLLAAHAVLVVTAAVTYGTQYAVGIAQWIDWNNNNDNPYNPPGQYTVRLVQCGMLVACDDVRSPLVILAHAVLGHCVHARWVAHGVAVWRWCTGGRVAGVAAARPQLVERWCWRSHTAAATRRERRNASRGGGW